MVVMKIFIARLSIISLLICATTIGAVADDNYVYPLDFNISEFEIVRLIISTKADKVINANGLIDASRDKRRLDFFNRKIETALQQFNGYPPIKSYQRARHRLRLAFIGIGSNELIYLRRQEFSILETPARFLKLYDKVALWAEKIILMDGAEIFHFHKYYKLSRGGYRHREIAKRLFELAVKKNHPAALWERFYDYLLKSKGEPHACSAERILKKLYTLGDHKAVLELARRYKDGDRFANDRAWAVYWYAKALLLKGEDIVLKGEDVVTSVMIELGREFDESDKYWLHFWLRSEAPPVCLTEPR